MLKAHILRILAGAPASGVMLPMLRVEMSVRLGRKPGAAEMGDEVADLCASGLCTRGTDTLTGDETISLTAAGKKQAAKL